MVYSSGITNKHKGNFLSIWALKKFQICLGLIKFSSKMQTEEIKNACFELGEATPLCSEINAS